MPGGVESTFVLVTFRKKKTKTEKYSQFKYTQKENLTVSLPKRSGI